VTVADPQISQTAGCCIHRYLTQLGIADTHISQTAGWCKSTDIANSWMLHIHRQLEAASDKAGYCRYTDIADNWMLHIQRYRKQLNAADPQISQIAEY
jgi:hypothetical protein